MLHRSEELDMGRIRRTFNSFWDATALISHHDTQRHSGLSIPFGMLRVLAALFGFVFFVFLSIPFGMLH